VRSAVFADIDGTLIESVRRLGHAHEGAVGARDREGNAIAVHTPRHRQLLRLLEAADVLIPVTGRSVSALSRVELPFPSYAIVHHGALVLDAARARCTAYDERMRDALGATDLVLAEAFAEVTRWIAERAPSLRVYRQVIDERTIEVCVKHVSPTASSLGEEGDAIEEQWRGLSHVRIHRNGNNLALLPSGVTKESAVAWVVERLEETLGPLVTFGVGDSDTDLEFMRRCDFFVVPRGSQLERGLEVRG
jgi:HAD superfamily hydrolase (TIGR01484 family)